MTEAMKSCPFCGGEGRVIPHPGNKYRSNILYRPQCDRCGGGLGGFDTSAFAVAAWNLRAPAEAELEEMTLGRGRLRLWMEFIHLNCASSEAKEFAGEALNGAPVPEGFA